MFRRILKVLKRIFGCRRSMPDYPSYRLTKVGKMFNFVLMLKPPKPDQGVTKVEVVVAKDGVPYPIVVLDDVTILEIGPYEVVGAETMSGTIVDIDQSGNRSDPRPWSFVLDTTPPDEPDAPTFVLEPI